MRARNRRQAYVLLILVSSRQLPLVYSFMLAHLLMAFPLSFSHESTTQSGLRRGDT